MTKFFRNAKMLFALGVAFSMSKAVMHEAAAYGYCGCEYETLSIESYGYGYGDDDDDYCYDEPEFDEDADNAARFHVGSRRAQQNADHAGDQAGEPNGETGGALVLADNLTLTLDAEVAEIYDEILGGDGNDYNATLWLDSNYGPWTYGLGFGFDRYRISQKNDIRQDSYSLDLYVMYNIIDNLHIGGFIDLSYVDVDNATISYKGDQVIIGGNDWYYGAGLLAAYDYTYDVYTFSLNSTLASMLKEDVGDLFDSENSQWYSTAAVSRPITDQLSLEAYVGWTWFFDRSGNRDEAYGTTGVAGTIQITDKWSTKIGVETDFAQTGYESRVLNASVTYAW